MFIYSYNNLSLQAFLWHCLITNMSKKIEFTEMDQIVTDNDKFNDLLAQSTYQQLYSKMLWLATPPLHSLLHEWSVPFRISQRKNRCVLWLCRGCSLV